MEYKLMGKNNYESDILKTIFDNRGLGDYRDFISMGIEDINDPSLFKNMQEGVELLDKHILNKSRIHILIDADLDGFMSSAIIFNYIKELGYDMDLVTWNNHEGKQHGIQVVDGEIGEFSTQGLDLLIVPDAGSSDYKAHNILAEKGIDVLILDHHNIEEDGMEKTHADNHSLVVINCQDGVYPNNTLSGAGVTMKFVEAMDKYLDKEISINLLDLAAIGNIGDMMDMTNKETHLLTQMGLKNIKNPLILAIIKKNEFSIGDKLNMIKVAFNIAPLFNAASRVGTLEEKDNIFRALTDDTIKVEYTKRGCKPELVFLYEDMARQMTNIKSKQDRQVKKALPILEEKIKEKNLNRNNIIFMDVTKHVESSFTGLVANKLQDLYKKPILLLRQKQNNPKEYGGSGRNYKHGNIEDLQKILKDTGCFDKVAGHDNAFGIGITKGNVKKAYDMASKALEGYEVHMGHDVDFIFDVSELKMDYITKIDQLFDFWSRGIEECKIAVENVRVENTEKNFKVTKRKGFSFRVGGISYVKAYGVSSEMLDKMQNSGIMNLTVVGKPSINDFAGLRNPQIDIIDFEFEPAVKDISDMTIEELF